MAQGDWWDENGLGALPDDQNYPGGSATFNEQVTGPSIYGESNGWNPGDSGSAPAGSSQGGGAQKSGNPAADWQAFVQSNGYSGTYARQNMAQLVNEFNSQYGYNARAGNPNASGLTDTVDFGDGGGLRDLIHGGDDAWQNIPDSPGGGGGGAPAGAGGGGMGATPEELRSYGVPGNQYASSAYGGGYTAPTWGNQFTAPTLSESNDPGLAARFAFGQQALERSAAAKGTILNGGTQQATAMFGQDYASNEYANVFNRAFDQYKQKYGEFKDAADLGLRAEQNQYGEYLGEQARTLNDYLTNYNIGRTGVQDFLNQQNKTADRGLNATLGGRP